LILKLNRFSPLTLIFSFCLIHFISAQEIEKGYFRSPVKPGGRNFLAGNFAELRPNHFHTGLDYKFGGTEGEPILAAADGWIQRIKISSFGYGNVIYIRHPNGKITLYGHLRNFNPKITQFMRKKMYEAQLNELEVTLNPGELPVKKGEQIANGGNTGNSGGPHLHFEIRDSLDRAMDPLLFGFPEILDNIAPTPQKIALVPLDIDSRVNGKFQRVEVTPIASGGSYRIPATIQITGRVGIEVQSYDQLDGADNRNGFPNFELSDDAGTIFSLTVDKVDFNFTRQFLLYTHQNRFTKLYHQEHLKFDFFQPKQVGVGHLELDPGVKKNYQLKLRDAYGNQRLVTIPLQGQDLEQNVVDGAAPARATVNYIGNILKIRAPISPNGGLAKFYVGANIFEMLPAYQDKLSRTYLWDMHFGIPEEIDICSEVVLLNIKTIIPAGKDHLFADNQVQISFAENTVLDDLFMRLKHSGTPSSPKLELHDPADYLWNPMDVVWDVSGFTGNKERFRVYQQSSNGGKSFVGGTWEGGAIRFKTRNFGTFILAEDNIKPTITPIRVNSSEMRFTIKDNLSGIKIFEAKINDKWVMMRYEHKQAVIWSDKLDEQPFRGSVVLRVTDQTGNVAEWKGTIG
jgi:murein DD-endopeptidase MepM/ murein hydrolase activator NlpD